MHNQNKEKVIQIYEQIKKNFKNMTNSNRIGKFYPSIIKFFLQVLSAIIKFSFKFNKFYLESFYLNKYILVIHIVKNTVINRFVNFNIGGVENDFKYLGRFFFFDVLFKYAVYSFIRYTSFEFIMIILNYILETYKNNINEQTMVNMEHVLLLKTNYNLGLILYTMGNTTDSIPRFIESMHCLDNIYYFPYTITQFTLKQKNQKINISSILDKSKSTLSSFNIDESVEKILNNKKNKKRSVSTKVDYDNSIKEKEVYFGLKQKYCSVIYFGKNKIYILENEKNVENYIRLQIIFEIELILAEIELDKKNFQKSFSHLNNIFNTLHISFNNIKNKLTHIHTFKESDNRNSLDFFKKESIQEAQKNTIEITEVNRRRIFHILHQIEYEYKDRGYNNYELYLNKSQKNLEEIKDISSNDSYSSRSGYSQNFIPSKKFSDFYKEQNIMLATEKFFIFICNLSLYQLKILNEFQPEQSQKRDELPIIFPNQFKDCLTFNQRLSLNYLDTMSLSRCVILIDPKKDICPENLNYFFLANKKYERRRKSAGEVNSRKWKKPRFKTTRVKNVENENIFKNDDISMNLSSINNKNRYGFRHHNTIIGPKNNLKKILFIQGKFEKFLEEGKIFDKLINNDKINLRKSRIFKIMNGLDSEEKELLMKDKKYLEVFIRNIAKKMKNNKNS